MSEGGEVARIGDALEGGQTVEVAMEEERTVPDVCFSFAELAELLPKRGGGHAFQKMMDVRFDDSFDS